MKKGVITDSFYYSSGFKCYFTYFVFGLTTGVIFIIRSIRFLLYCQVDLDSFDIHLSFLASYYKHQGSAPSVYPSSPYSIHNDEYTFLLGSIGALSATNI